MSSLNFKEEILVFCGPMYSGKSNALLMLVDRLKHAKVPYFIFKPDMDRFSDVISTRYIDMSEKAISIDIKNPKVIFDHINLDKLMLPMTVIIDEAQFFGDDLLEVVKKLHSKGVNLVISGLDMDAWNNPFGVMPKILAVATKVIKLRSVCKDCKSDATRSAILSVPETGSNIIVGQEERFFALCSKCYYKFMDEQERKSGSK